MSASAKGEQKKKKQKTSSHVLDIDDAGNATSPFVNELSWPPGKARGRTLAS